MERVEKQVGEKRTYFDMQMERKSQHEEMDAVKNRGVVRAEEERISTGKWLKKEGVMEYGSEPPCSWQSVCYQGQSDEDSEDEWEEEEQEEENHNNHEQDQSGEEGGDDGEEEENEDDKEEREDDEEEEEPDEEEEDSQQEEDEYLVEGQDQEQKEGQQHDQVEDTESDIDGNLWRWRERLSGLLTVTLKGNCTTMIPWKIMNLKGCFNMSKAFLIVELVCERG